MDGLIPIYAYGYHIHMLSQDGLHEKAVLYHKKIVESGADAIHKVLAGDDADAKERLLLCLDYYLDPYYKNTLPYESEIIKLLEHVIISGNPLSVKEDALNLLTSYAYPPFYILEQNLGQIEDQLMPDVMYALNMGRSDGLLHALLD